MEGIEFTDRYGGRAPSWLRACLRCEAMGCYPDMSDPTVPFDDIPFVQCRACAGTGRVSWLRTLVRVPRWLWRSARFIAYCNRHHPGPATMTAWQNIVLAFKCAILADLGLWRP